MDKTPLTLLKHLKEVKFWLMYLPQHTLANFNLKNTINKREINYQQ